MVAAYKCQAIGGDAQTVVEFLENRYREDLPLEDAVVLAAEALARVIEEPIDAGKLEMAVVPTKTASFRKLSETEIAEHIKKVKESTAKPAKE